MTTHFDSKIPDVVEEFDRLSSDSTSRYESSDYQQADHCQDALRFSEDALIAKIDLDNQEVRTHEQCYYRDLEEDLRNRFTGIRLIEKLEKLDELRRRVNSGGVR